jgi:pSer/pThr/pTyr-binding forkhead associated (FHA) protein
MNATLRLTVVTGPHRGKKFCFCGPKSCLLGRADDCLIRLAGTERDQLVSRHHCLLSIDPPVIQIKDLGSQNGTFVNGRMVGSEDICLTPPGDDDRVAHAPDYLTVGGTTFRLDMVNCKGDATHMWPDGETAKIGCQVPCP